MSSCKTLLVWFVSPSSLPTHLPVGLHPLSVFPSGMPYGVLQLEFMFLQLNLSFHLLHEEDCFNNQWEILLNAVFERDKYLPLIWMIVTSCIVLLVLCNVCFDDYLKSIILYHLNPSLGNNEKTHFM